MNELQRKEMLMVNELKCSANDRLTLGILLALKHNNPGSFDEYYKEVVEKNKEAE